MKQTELQRYVLKIHSAKLRKANWNLTLPLSDARKNDEVISLASSQMLRWIDELNGDDDCEEEARRIRAEIKRLRNLPNDSQNKREIRKLYSQLDKIQFKPDYLCIIMDRNSDYRRLCKGFKINGISYKRMLGTSGGIKMSTIVFVSKRLYKELNRRVNNGRDTSKMFNPAKLEAYKALSCSASHPVSMPDGIAVVSDCYTEFYDKVIHLKNASGKDEPIMSEPMEDIIKLDASDGFGLMLPSLARKWSEDVGLNYTSCGFNTRFSFEKGMVYTFDFLDFAENVAHQFIIKDVWGHDVDLRNVELVLTESMVKLWDSYSSCNEYLRKSLDNKYTFAITKTAPEELENERALNYQFIQSFRLDSDDINDLVSTSLNEIESALGGDWTKTLLFLRGSGMTEKNVLSEDHDYVTRAIMIYPDIVKDPYVQDYVYKQIRGRIREAKTGVLNVHGNFSMASGDPYSLCQHIFGMKVTGLLKSGEIYNQYWRDVGATDLVCFRAPMSCHNNIRKLKVANRDDVNYWYQYIGTCTIFNSWDTCMPALNGMDFDGDLVMLTDNPTLVSKHRELPALMCEQSSASKIIPREKDFVLSNISGFGNDIGKITNRITSMYELQSRFGEDSDECKILDYRICCGQLHQQDTIDKIKGVIAKPMPKTWYDYHSLQYVSEEDKELYRKTLAYRKPYFMRYIYPQLSKEYSEDLKKYDRNSLMLFDISLNDLVNKYPSELSDDEKEFLDEYNSKMLLGRGECVMNQICYLFENRFDSVASRRISNDFDYTILKSDAEYSQNEYYKINKLYQEYKAKIQNYVVHLKYEREDQFDVNAKVDQINSDFIAECSKICTNKYSLCNIVLDITYNTNTGKMFAWSMCGDVILENLMNKFGHQLTFPILDNNGDISYCGNNFALTTVKLEEQ